MGLRSLLDILVFSIASVVSLTPAAVWADGVNGRVIFEGKPPAGRIIRMMGDPYCMSRYPRGILFQPVQVGKGGGLADVFVYVKKGLEGKKFDVPKEARLVLDQKDCWYSPRVSGVMAGQSVEILNSDSTMHNVNARSEFNRAMPGGVKKIDAVFQNPQIMLSVRCNVHPWMVAYVGVLEHPFYAVTEKDGAFRIPNVPPGEYTLEAWHETLGILNEDVTLGKLESKVQFKFKSQ